MKLRTLDLDIENRPLTYLGSDFTTGEITCIAWGWDHDPDTVKCELLTTRVSSGPSMLRLFLEAYNAADIVTGHYILGHDLPTINGALLEYGLPPLGQKLVSDTKIHLSNRKYVSASQESLAGMLGCASSKVHMTQAMWRESNRLTQEGLEYTRDRCIGDVIQHMEMRQKLIEIGWLKPPVVWRGGADAGPYVP